MRSRFIGGLALIALIAGAATLSTATHARAADVAAVKEVIPVSAPAPQALALVHPTYTVTAAHGVDLVMCVALERASDSASAVNDSLLGRLRVVVPRRFESTIAPPNPSAGALHLRSHASRRDPSDSSTSGAYLRSLRFSS